MEIVKAVQEWSSVISAVLSLSVVGLLVTIVREKLSIHEERLKLAREENEKLKQDVRKVGASLGIEEFKEKTSSVKIRDVGENFSGKIAGRDINESISNIGEALSNIKEQINNTQQTINQHFGERGGGSAYEYDLDYVFERPPEKRLESFRSKIRTRVQAGWEFYSATSDYNGTDGMILLFRRAEQPER